MRGLFFLIFLLSSAFSAKEKGKAPKEKPAKASIRFASLKSDQVNVRVGPGENFPIRFVFNRQNWPVKIIYDFEDWRKIVDAHGHEGWAHRRTLCGKPYAITRKKGFLYKNDGVKAPRLAVLQKDVCLLVKKCKGLFCKAEVTFQNQIYTGWVSAKNLWGPVVF